MISLKAGERIVIALETPERWPQPILIFLNEHHDLFLSWAQGPTRPDPRSYDNAIYGLMDRLQPYFVVGWHCTRLTDSEIAKIINAGMELPMP